jgi:hypothetical protein
MKRRGIIASTLAAAVALSVPFAAHAQEVKLRVANWLPPVHHRQRPFGHGLMKSKRCQAGKSVLRL